MWRASGAPNHTAHVPTAVPWATLWSRLRRLISLCGSEAVSVRLRAGPAPPSHPWLCFFAAQRPGLTHPEPVLHHLQEAQNDGPLGLELAGRLNLSAFSRSV